MPDRVAATAVRRERCPRSIRHWFTIYGCPGLRRPDCARCGAPNPYWNDEMQELWDEWERLNADEDNDLYDYEKGLGLHD